MGEPNRIAVLRQRAFPRPGAIDYAALAIYVATRFPNIMRRLAE